MSNSRSRSVAEGKSIASATSKMHWLVVGWMGVGALFTTSFPIAMWRVSQTPKFAGQSFNSLDCAGKMPSERIITTSEACASLVVPPLPAKK
jgi:argininosuccinate lyase